MTLFGISIYYVYICHMNVYTLYLIRVIKGVMMVDPIHHLFADNIIEAEYSFEKEGYLTKDVNNEQEYLITVKKP